MHADLVGFKDNILTIYLLDYFDCIYLCKHTGR
jgi:hypothetical protein